MRTYSSSETPMLWVQDANGECLLDMFQRKSGIITVIWRGIPIGERDQTGMQAVLAQCDGRFCPLWLHDFRAVAGPWDFNIPFILNTYIPACRQAQPQLHAAFVVGNNRYSHEAVQVLLAQAEQRPSSRLEMFDTPQDGEEWLLSLPLVQPAVAAPHPPPA